MARTDTDGNNESSSEGQFNVLDYGAVGDGIALGSVSVTNGDATLTCASASFTSADIGKVICVFYQNGGIDNRADFVSTIASINSATSIEMAGTCDFTNTDSNAVYGTSDSQAFEDAFTAAATHFNYVTDTSPNIPIGGGQPIVFVPIGENYGNYILTETLAMPRGTGIDAIGKLWNCNSTRGDDFITAEDYNYIDKLTAYSMWGGGVRMGNNGTTGSQSHSYVGRLELWNITGTVLAFEGYGYTVDTLWLKNGDDGIFHNKGADVTVNTAFLIGCYTPLKFDQSNQITYNSLFLDSCGGTGTEGGIVFDNTTGGSSNITIKDFQAFTFETVSRVCTPMVNFMNNGSSKYSTITIRGHVNNSGGSLIAMNDCQEIDVRINGSNYINTYDANLPITTGMEFGSGNSGFCRVHLNLTSGITPYTGTVYNGFSYYQGGIEYRMNGYVAEDNTVGSENTRILARRTHRYYDADSSNYIGLRAQTNVTANFTFDLPAADGTSGQALVTNGSGILSFATVGSPTTTEITGTTQQMAVNSVYIANNAGLVTATLPDTAAVGDTVEVIGKGAGGWLIAQNASESINFGNATTTVGAGGSLASTHRYDCIKLRCTVANTTWTKTNVEGNITIV